MDLIEDAEHRGAKTIMAPSREGCIIYPTIILSDDNKLRIVEEEIFGPVAVVIPAKNVKDAI